MSILTKICVVLLLVMVLLACPVFINMATVPWNYRNELEKQKRISELRLMQANHTELARDRLDSELKEALRARQELEARLTQANDRLRAELDAAKLANSELTTQLGAVNARLTLLEANYKEYLQQQKLLEGQLAQTRDSNRDLADENRRVNDLLQVAQAIGERLETQARLLQEQIAEREEKIKELGEQIVAKGAVGRGAEGVEVPSPADITGTVTTVDDDLAEINIGSAQGIKPGMKLIIYRGAEFAANLQIDEVNIDKAAGFIVDRRLDPRKGDKVTSSTRGQ